MIKVNHEDFWVNRINLKTKNIKIYDKLIKVVKFSNLECSLSKYIGKRPSRFERRFFPRIKPSLCIGVLTTKKG